MNIEKQTEFFECMCHSHIITLTKYKDDNDLSISIFEHGLGEKKYRFKAKLNHIWQIIWYGTPHLDSVILQEKDVKRFLETLQKLFI